MIEPRIVRLSDLSDAGLYDQAAALHMTSILHGLLPELGRQFLARLYLEIDRAPRSGVWAALESDRVIGFLAGSADTGRCYRSVLRRAAPRMALLAGKALVRGRVLRRMPALILYPLRSLRGQNAETSGLKAELLAIAVHPEARGLGIGTALISAFELALASWGMSSAYRVATNAADDVSNEFYKKAGFSPAYRHPHNALTLQVYVKELPQQEG